MNTRTVIVGEDDAEVSTYLEMALRYQGYTVKAARDGAEVMELLSDGDASLVLLDIMMPRQDGIETLRQIRRNAPRLPVIVISGVASEAKVSEALRSGATSVLAKPLVHEQLLTAVRNATEDGADAVTACSRPVSSLSQQFFSANPKMQLIRSGLRQVAASDVPVVIRGESGVGKEVLARELHAQSARASKPFLKINCAAVPQELLESELFGYERGAFTGAVKSTPGKFEVADGGTLLLDEIGDMDFKLQAKLLHVLQDCEFHRLGGRDVVRVNVRVLAATHCDLEQAIAEKRFREDLYYRLNVITVNLPPLRERKDEILPLAELFLRKHAVAGVNVPDITLGLREALLAHNWPGNIRELENVMRKFLVFRDAEMLALDLREKTRVFAPATAVESRVVEMPPMSALEAVNEARKRDEAQTILQALDVTRWNRKRAAEMLGVDYKVLLYRMKKLGIGEPATEPVRPSGAYAPPLPPERVQYARA